MEEETEEEMAKPAHEPTQPDPSSIQTATQFGVPKSLPNETGA
jgi:hypothetical protein